MAEPARMIKSWCLYCSSLRACRRTATPVRLHQEWPHVVPEGEPGLYLHLPGKGRLERDVITFNWTSKRVDKVARQSEMERDNKTP